MKTCFACGQTIHIVPEPGKNQRHAMRDNFKGFGYQWLCVAHAYDDISSTPFEAKI